MGLRAGLRAQLPWRGGGGGQGGQGTRRALQIVSTPTGASVQFDAERVPHADDRECELCAASLQKSWADFPRPEAAATKCRPI